MRDGDEFDRAEVDDWELERAADKIEWAADWLELHGDPLVRPTLEEAIAQEGRDRAAADRRTS